PNSAVKVTAVRHLGQQTLWAVSKWWLLHLRGHGYPDQRWKLVKTAWRAWGREQSESGLPQQDALQFTKRILSSSACETLTGHRGRGQGGRQRQGSDSRHECPTTTGKNPTDEYLEGMMSEAPGPINFTMFLTMFGEKLNGTDPEDVIRNAFACFDEEASGFIHEDHLRELLTTMGDRFTDEEVDEMYREAPIDKKGNFNYVEFTRILKHGAKDKDD
uniref:Myosin light chain 9 n=1 Tax=Suricata suricatta TaxID=37032 RepID=A0A673U814_SURSU